MISCGNKKKKDNKNGRNKFRTVKRNAKRIV